MKIIIADDHPIIRQGYRQILSDQKEITCIDEVSDGRELISKLEKNDYDVIILDLSMPGMSGIEFLSTSKGMKKKLNILVITMHPEEQYAMRVLKAGASGYLTKACSPLELIDAVKSIASGNRYITHSLAEKLATYICETHDNEPHHILSDREHEIMIMIAKGLKPKEIASTLCISPKTVNTYRSRILEKMEFENNAQLTSYAIDKKLI